jgi:ATPase family associated with various cellular activities (AAA)
MNFPRLEALRRSVGELRSAHVSSLKQYHDQSSNGFARKHDDIKLSLASSATCVASLISTGNWYTKECAAWRARDKDLVNSLLSAPLKSAELKNTPFTIAFVLEVLTLLFKSGACGGGAELTADQKQKLDAWERKLKQALLKKEHPGAVKIREYPPTAYVTQLVVRVLDLRNALDPKPRRDAQMWSVAEINRQIALFANQDKTADVYSLAYATILLARLSSPLESTPEEVAIERAAIKLLFEKQLPDGSWPPGRPLFHYPGAGNAYCYEYEMLVQLLSTETLQPMLLDYLEKLGEAAYSLKSKAFRFAPGALAWASGHHPSTKGPESWSTASVFHFLYSLDRLIAESIRAAVFQHLDQEYLIPKDPDLTGPIFPDSYLDSMVEVADRSESLKDLLGQIVIDVATNASVVKSGRALPEGTAMSVIFFGPPGTSKTDVTRRISEVLGWPRLTVDPSHLVKYGMDRVQAEANRLFSMLAAAERIVVLLDEFDEMVRERGAHGTEALSRFLTTAMLPKLTLINERRRILFLLATNHIEQFDFAISRLGRFDRIIQIMPPTAAAKRRHWAAPFNRLPGTADADLELLTYSECKNLVKRLEDPSVSSQDALQEAVKSCTLRKIARTLPNGEQITWERECVLQRQHNRI